MLCLKSVFLLCALICFCHTSLMLGGVRAACCRKFSQPYLRTAVLSCRLTQNQGDATGGRDDFPDDLLPAFNIRFARSNISGKSEESRNPVRIASAEAHDFLLNSRPKRNLDPKWYRGDPDFQSYYRLYNSIGHIEGLYEVDRIRMLYQQMRHLELVYGSDASTYQNAMGLLTSTTGPATVTQPPPPPTTPASTPDPLENAQKVFLCNPKDPLCKPRIVYLPTGALPILCDPRLNPKCRPQTEEEMKAATPPPFPPATPAPTTSDPPAPPAPTGKGMEYDCDPYWDPDCLIDHPPKAVQETSAPAEPSGEEMTTEEDVKSETEPVVSATQKSIYFDPYDFKRDLYDPFRYAPNPQ